MEDDENLIDMNSNDGLFGNFNIPTEPKKKKLDISGAISVTGDRLNLSYRQRAMIASNVVQAAGISVHDTNISVTTAWRKGKDKRTEKAEKSRTISLSLTI